MNNTGIAALITVITVTLFLISVGFLIANRGGSSIFSGQYESQATHTQFLADTGIHDALIKLARDKDYTGSYALSDANWTVDISVASSGDKIITATSSVTTANITINRTMQATVIVDTDGKIINVTKINL